MTHVTRLDDGKGRTRLCQVSKIKKRDMMGIMGIVNDNKTKMNSVIFFILSTKTCSGWVDAVSYDFVIFRERERVPSV